MMLQITLNSKEQDFVRQALIFVERHYNKQVDIDHSLLDSPLTFDKSLYERMLRDDLDKVSMAKSLYFKFLD